MGVRQLPTAADVDSLTLQELQAILEEEIGNLPEKYALPLTLCYLEGKTNAQAAEQLGWPEGSMSRRLSRAREILRSRMVRRGLAMSAALIAAVFARSAAACPVPPDLLATTTTSGSLVLRGVPLEEVVAARTAAVVRDVLAGFTSAGSLTGAAFLASGAIALVMAVLVWQFQTDTSPRSSARMLRTWMSSSCDVSHQPAVVSQPGDQESTSQTVAATCAGLPIAAQPLSQP